MWLRTLRKWLARRHNPIQIIKKIAARRGAKPMLEILEDRLAPTVGATVNYNSSANELDLLVNASETVLVTESASNTIQVQLNNSDTISLTGGASSNANFVETTPGGKTTLTISNVSSAVDVNTFNAYLANQASPNADTLTFGLGPTPPFKK